MFRAGKRDFWFNLKYNEGAETLLGCLLKEDRGRKKSYGAVVLERRPTGYMHGTVRSLSLK